MSSKKIRNPLTGNQIIRGGTLHRQLVADGNLSRNSLKPHKKTPIRRRSKSPIRRRSKSPVRRRSKSPVRRRSKSPVRRRSKSPVRRRSLSPDHRRLNQIAKQKGSKFVITPLTKRELDRLDLKYKRTSRLNSKLPRNAVEYYNYLHNKYPNG